MTSATGPTASKQDMPLPRKLWEHPDPQSTQMAKFIRHANQKRNLKLQKFRDLYDWSVGPRREDFWVDAWEYLPIIYEGRCSKVVERGVRMDRIPRWFTGVRVNYAENILYTPSPASPSRRTTLGKEDSKIAVTQVREGCSDITRVTWRELRQRTARLSSAMRAWGVTKGDRVAVVASNSVDTLTVFLAVTALGGIFSSSSTDMGVRGILDRLLQIKPRWLFMDDSALYNGKLTDLRDKMTAVVLGMKDVKEFQGLVSMARWEEFADISKVPRSHTLQDFLHRAAPSSNTPEFVRVESADPFVIVYSSGTTGQPKCITHGTGGILISHLKEGVLHRDWDQNTVVLQYTTTAWIMYLSCISALLHGARSILYDGSPFLPDEKRFLRLIGEERVTNLGVSPRWFQTLASASISPREVTDLSALKGVTSTGMVLSDALFNWFYDTGFPAQTQLSNISGGTDLAGCFGLENPLEPVYVGGCQGPCVGTPIAIYDSTIEATGDGSPPQGRSVELGAPGDLVATDSFPNMPVFFWGDAAGRRYFDAYFARFDNVWTHGDFVMQHPQTGQLTFLGRADGVLNPSGVRFGSAEIYSVIEREFGKTVQDSVCVGQRARGDSRRRPADRNCTTHRRPQDTDESVMLFLKMQPNVRFSQALVDDIRAVIARECSKRHVPKYIFETPEIPTTVNMKKVELPIKQIVSGRTIKPSGTLANPDSLNFYYQFQKVEDVVTRRQQQQQQGRRSSKL